MIKLIVNALFLLCILMGCVLDENVGKSNSTSPKPQDSSFDLTLTPYDKAAFTRSIRHAADSFQSTYKRPLEKILTLCNSTSIKKIYLIETEGMPGFRIIAESSGLRTLFLIEMPNSPETASFSKYSMSPGVKTIKFPYIPEQTLVQVSIPHVSLARELIKAITLNEVTHDLEEKLMFSQNCDTEKLLIKLVTNYFAELGPLSDFQCSMMPIKRLHPFNKKVQEIIQIKTEFKVGGRKVSIAQTNVDVLYYENLFEFVINELSDIKVDLLWPKIRF